MTDISDRLRAASCCNGNCNAPERQDELCINSRLRGEAADAIERLRITVNDQAATITKLFDEVQQLQERIKRATTS